MEIQLPPKFEKHTRWAYIKERIEYGPFSASEIVGLMRDKMIGPDTELVELSTRKIAPLQNIGPFLDAFKVVFEEAKRKEAQAEFEATRSRLAGRAKTKVWGVVIAVLVGLAGLVTVVIVMNLSGSKEAPKVIEIREERDRTVKTEKKKEESNEPVIHEAAIEDPETDEAEEHLIVANLKEERILATSTKAIGMDTKKTEALPQVKALPGVKGGKNGASNGSTVVTEGGSKGGGMETLDFSEDEVEEKGPGQSKDSSIKLGKERLNKVVKGCVQRAVMNNDDLPRMTARASCKLGPDGLLRSVSIEAKPNLHVGEVKMCVSADLAASSVPAFDGPEVSLSTVVTVGTVEP